VPLFVAEGVAGQVYQDDGLELVLELSSAYSYIEFFEVAEDSHVDFAARLAVVEPAGAQQVVR